MSESRSRLSRRGFLAVGAGALVVASVPLATRTRRRLHRRDIPIMGTVAEISVVHDDAPHAQLALDAAVAELQRIERLMTRYTRTSDVGRVNLTAPGVAAVVSAETAGVVLAALAWAEASDGAFDPAIERVTSLWHVEDRTAPPSGAELRRLAGRRLHRALELSSFRGRTTIVRHDADVGLDLGGIAKGYAVDRAAEVLRAHGITSGIVNVGGDLVTIGTAPEGGAWRVGVRSPSDPTGLIGTLEVRDAAVATSGDYERFFVHAGTRYHHLMDPGTAAPRRTSAHGITILAASCLQADAAATTCFGMDTARARAVFAAAHATAEIVLPGGTLA